MDQRDFEMKSMRLEIDTQMGRALASLEKYESHHEDLFSSAESFVTNLCKAITIAQTASVEFMAAESKKAVQEQAPSVVKDLRAVRDSLEHVDERLLGKARGRKIEPLPYESQSIKADGGARFLSVIDDNVFLATASDGRQVGIPLTKDTYLAVRDYIVNLLER